MGTTLPSVNQAPSGATRWRPSPKTSTQGEVAWDDPGTRRQVQRRYIAPIIGAVLVVLAVVTGLVVWQRIWYMEWLAPWLVVLCAGVAAGALIGTIFGALAAWRIRTVVRNHPWQQHKLVFGDKDHSGEVAIEQGRQVADFAADFPGPALTRLQGATVLLPVCGDGDLRVVGLDLGSEQQARLGILRAREEPTTPEPATPGKHVG